MTISSQYTDGALIISLCGELDHHTASRTMHETRQIVDRFLPKRCALDLSQLCFMDSSGVAFILRLRKVLRSCGASFWLLCPAEQPLRVIEASGVGRLVNVIQKESERMV